MTSTEIAWVNDRWRPVAYALRSAATALPAEDIDFVFAHLPHRWLPKYDEQYNTLCRELGDWSSARAHIWLERIDWQREPPDGLFDAIERIVEELEHAEKDLRPDVHMRRMRKELERCGFTLTAAPVTVIATVGQDAVIPIMADGITIALGRLRRALSADPDPHGALGYAKDLIEATAKFVLTSLGEPIGERPRLPQLIERTQEALGVRAAGQTDTLVRQLCGSVAKQASVVVELRNQVKGSAGHGSAQRDTTLRPFHARLAADAAAAWSQFVLAALEDISAADRSESS